MIEQTALRRGWCPGALTPMQTGDGWLVRVRPRGGGYSLAQLTAITDVAKAFGNGEIDLTNRANLQIRGLYPASIPHAQDRLADAGLIDDNAAAEAVRNVIAAPLAGLDPQAADIRPLARDLEAALVADDRVKALPGKFGFAVDGGGSFPLATGLADITLRTREDAINLLLAGNTAMSARVPIDQAVPAALSLAVTFIAAANRDPAIRRMRGLVTAVGAASVFTQAGLEPHHQTCDASPPDALPISTLGPSSAPWALGIGLPFGRIRAATLLQLIAAARDCHVTDLRPAPGRILIAPVRAVNASKLALLASQLGLMTTASDPRLTIDVCPGAPACERGTTATRYDAEKLAAAFARQSLHIGSVHVSGCAKGCARSGPASITLVARDGLYDLIRHGTVSCTPTQTGISSERLPGVLTAVAGDHDD